MPVGHIQHGPCRWHLNNHRSPELFSLVAVPITSGATGCERFSNCAATAACTGYQCDFSKFMIFLFKARAPLPSLKVRSAPRRQVSIMRLVRPVSTFAADFIEMFYALRCHVLNRLRPLNRVIQLTYQCHGWHHHWFRISLHQRYSQQNRWCVKGDFLANLLPVCRLLVSSAHSETVRSLATAAARFWCPLLYRHASTLNRFFMTGTTTCPGELKFTGETTRPSAASSHAFAIDASSRPMIAAIAPVPSGTACTELAAHLNQDAPHQRN